MAGLAMLRTLDGEAVWPPPLWLMRQAGRYLPEYRAIRSRAGDFLSLVTTPKLAAEVTLQPLRRYGFDGAILFSDILILPWALGHGLAYKEGEGPVLPRLTDAADLARLDLGKLSDAVAPILETVRRVRDGLATEGHEAALIGFAGGPFTVACYMVEGGGSKDFAATRRMAYAEPALFGALVERLTEATIAYLSAQADAGADCLMLFDSWAGVLSPSLFDRHVLAPTRRIVRALSGRVRVIGFPRLAGTRLAAYAATGVDAVGMDTGTDPVWTRDSVPEGVTLQGNLDPMALLAGGAALRHETSAILTAMRGRAFIFNLGHGIVPDTPPEHVAALVRLVRGG
jgi:uroporphyrinogen decarboxylase